MGKWRRGWLVERGGGGRNRTLGQGEESEAVNCNTDNRAPYLLLQPARGVEMDTSSSPQAVAGRETEGFLGSGLGRMEHVLRALLRELLLTETSPATLTPTPTPHTFPALLSP